MSEDRLEQALDEMRAEDLHAEQIETARARVWENVANTGGAVCAEFRPEFRGVSGQRGAGAPESSNELAPAVASCLKTISAGARAVARGSPR